MTALWITAFLVASVPWIVAFLEAAGRYAGGIFYVQGATLFTIVLAAAVTSLALAGMGTWLAVRVGARLPFLSLGLVFLALNLLADIAASVVYFSSPTCTGAYSGPCHPEFVCGAGLAFTIVALAFALTGLARAWQPHPGPAHTRP